MANDERIKVRIDDMNFYVVGGDNEEYIRALARTLNRNISETRRSNNTLNQVQSLVLTALNILDEKETLEQQEKNIVATTKDEKEVVNRLKELDAAKKEISQFEDTKDNYENSLNEFKNKIKELEDETKTLKNTIEEKENRINELIEKLNTSTVKAKKLEEEMYESQKTIIDLNREIESLTNEEE